MAGTFKHYWVGTTLMVESDSGVSGADLKGDTGDIGPRGPQGPAGVVVDSGGNLNIDLTGYATENYVDNKLTNYATKTYVDNAVANAGGGGGGGSAADMTNYYTKSDIDTFLLEKPSYDWVIEYHANAMPPTETWVFELEDGTTISKVVSLG